MKIDVSYDRDKSSLDIQFTRLGSMKDADAFLCAVSKAAEIIWEPSPVTRAAKAPTPPLAHETAVCDEICALVDEYWRQVGRGVAGAATPPGGLECMGDVWQLLYRWREQIIEARSPGSFEKLEAEIRAAAPNHMPWAPPRPMPPCIDPDNEPRNGDTGE